MYVPGAVETQFCISVMYCYVWALYLCNTASFAPQQCCITKKRLSWMVLVDTNRNDFLFFYFNPPKYSNSELIHQGKNFSWSPLSFLRTFFFPFRKHFSVDAGLPLAVRKVHSFTLCLPFICALLSSIIFFWSICTTQFTSCIKTLMLCLKGIFKQTQGLTVGSYFDDVTKV